MRHQNGHQTGRETRRRYTVHEAARLLGLSVEATRKRAERGKLDSIKEDGTVYILLDTDQTGPTADRTHDRTADQPALVEALRDQIEYLRAELERREDTHREESRRKDHIIAGLVERIPELPPPPTSPATTAGAANATADDPQGPRQEARDGRETAANGRTPPEAPETHAGPQMDAQRPWWLRWLGG